MSKFPFVITLLVSGFLVGWLHVSADGKSAQAGPGGSGRLTRLYGFPDERGILLDLRRRPGNACPAAMFRSESPEFVLWDDGTVVYRDSTYDYRRGKVSAAKRTEWLRTLRAGIPRRDSDGCPEFWAPRTESEWTRLHGRDALGGITVSVFELDRCAGAHADACAACRPLRPLARLVAEISGYRGEGDDVISGLPVEVYLEFRSCGCRNHPEIANVSKQWTLPGESPMERCGRASARMTLTDPGQIRGLSKALEGSAAVLDKGEIYTCFMRPLLDFDRQTEPLAKR